MAKNIVVRKKLGDTWVELHPATNGDNVALKDGKTVQKKVDEMKIRTYASISDLGIERGQESSLKQIIDAMAEHSKLSESIWYDKSFYPTTNGTIVIEKVYAGRVLLLFVGAVGTGHLWQASYDQNSFSGWRRVMTEKEVSNANLLINGDFQIWQDGTSFINANGIYTADMWKVTNNGSTSVKVYKTGNSLRMETTEFSTVVDSMTDLTQRFENNLAERLAGKTVALSGVIEKDTDVKGFFLLLHRNGSDEWAAEYVSFDTVDSEGQIKTTAKLPEDTKEIAVAARFFRTNIGAGKGVTIHNIKLEISEVATSFIPRSYAEELALCQRYYQKVGFISVQSNQNGNLIYTYVICSNESSPYDNSET